MTYKLMLNRLIEYAKSEGYEIDLEYTGVSYIKFSKNTLNTPKIIRLQKGSYEMRLYYLLHELGHHELRKDWVRFSELFPDISYAEEMELLTKSRKYYRRRSYKVSSMEEEFRAWDEGLLLSRRLGLLVNEVRYRLLRETCLMLYIRYYGK